jgi:hypothetical protein
MNSKTYEALINFYDGGVPGYVKSAGKTYIAIRVSDWQGNRKLKITLKDVIRYYETDARNIFSGVRTLAGYRGDWRHIDYVAKEALEWLKYVNRTDLEQEGEKRGMILIH